MSSEAKKNGFRTGGAVFWLWLIAHHAVCFAQDAALAETAAEAAPAEPVYVYRGGRDPFVPLIGQGAGAYAGGDETNGEEFNAGALELSGILKTRTGRWAVIRDPAGTSYLVKDGKIYDSKRKAVQGHVGIVKEKTLVVIGPNNQVTELALEKDEEER